MLMEFCNCYAALQTVCMPCAHCVCDCVGYIWAEDKEHCEEYGRMLQADPSKVSMRAKKRGLPQVGGSSSYSIS